MAAWSLVLQAGLDAVVEMGLKSSWFSSEEMIKRWLLRTGVTDQKEEDTSCCGLQLGGAHLPNRNPGHQVFEGERPLSPFSRASRGGQHGD